MTITYPFVLNVIAGSFAQLGADEARSARAALAAVAHCGVPVWLAEGHAFDIGFDGDGPVAREAVRVALGGSSVDVNVLPAANRKKKIFVADMDSTIIGCECIDELADMAGIKPKIATITERAMRGEIDFPTALRERVGLLKGLPLSALARVYAERVRLNPGAKMLLATMHMHGVYSVLVSGGFTYFTTLVAADAGFDEDRGNTLKDDGKTLIGEVGEPILGREAKLETLRETITARRLSFDDALAVGDGANDLAMIEKAGLGVAYHAKPVVASAARCAIGKGDLSALLYLQGYHDNEIVKG